MGEALNLDENWPAIRLPLNLSEDIVHVIRVSLNLPFDQWMRGFDHLTEDERQRAEQFRFEDPRRRFVTCRTVLRQLLGSCCGIVPREVPLQYGNHGKPGLANDRVDITSALEFSVSHSGDFGMIAVMSGAIVGIDIEECNPNIKALKLAERFFAPQESLDLHNLSPDKQLHGFYRGWTCKEAYIKAKGLGLALPLSDFCVEIDPDQLAALKQVKEQDTPPTNWTTRSLDVFPNYAAAVMVARPNCHVQCWDWQWISD